MKTLIFFDCEATGPCPGKRGLTLLGAVAFASRRTFHGVPFESRPNPDNPAHSEVTGRAFDPVRVFTAFELWLLSVTSGRCIFVSDNPAFDFQRTNCGFHHAIGRNPFGHSGRRISDFSAGPVGDFGDSQARKRLRLTPHDHNPVNDAMGNVEAFARLLNGERP